MKPLSILLLFISSIVFGQTDTIIKNEAYTSYYSYKFKAPLLVVYKLVNGGGDCKREGMDFKSDGLNTAHDADYKGTGYDKGHLANAEDFANNCKYEELTFRFYNCYPQTPELNRGPWRTLESEVRDLSKSDTLIVFTGGFYNNNKIGKGVSVPDTCWKVVYSVKNKNYKYSNIFTNTKNPTYKFINIYVLNYLLKQRYGLDITKIVKTYK